MTWGRFQAQMGPGGALLVGSPEELAEKISRHAKALGGVDRLTFQLDTAELPHERLLATIALIGNHLKPMLENL